MLKVFTITTLPFYQNARVVADLALREAAVVDPGAEVDRIIEQLRENGLVCQQIWLTHSHLDHCGGVLKLKEAFPQAFLAAHAADKYLRESVIDEAKLLGLELLGLQNCPEPDRYIEDGDKLSVGNYVFTVLHTPGHSPGHVAFVSESSQQVISGDTIFNAAIGRVDLKGGDAQTLLRSVRTKLLCLAPETALLCGHGADTTVATEKHINPYFK